MEAGELPDLGRVQGEPRQYQEPVVQYMIQQGIALYYAEDIAPARGISEGGRSLYYLGYRLLRISPRWSTS